VDQESGLYTTRMSKYWVVGKYIKNKRPENVETK
jgi:hypothetical protein